MSWRTATWRTRATSSSSRPSRSATHGGEVGGLGRVLAGVLVAGVERGAQRDDDRLVAGGDAGLRAQAVEAERDDAGVGRGELDLGRVGLVRLGVVDGERAEHRAVGEAQRDRAAGAQARRPRRVDRNVVPARIRRRCRAVTWLRRGSAASPHVPTSGPIVEAVDRPRRSRAERPDARRRGAACRPRAMRIEARSASCSRERWQTASCRKPRRRVGQLAGGSGPWGTSRSARYIGRSGRDAQDPGGPG